MLDERVQELSRALALMGLDLQRYTSSLSQGFLARWPSPGDWTSAEARASLLSAFAIGETSFMRHPEQFAALRSLLPELCERRAGSPLRVFSAGCASGEEAYSLAATLSEVAGRMFELTAWDVNPEAIARARLGEYRPWSMRGVDSGATDGWLDPSPCGMRVQNWLRERVSFQVGNLYLDSFPRDVDVVFCRNVLLYFKPDAAARVIARLADSLRPGGVLFLGHYDPRPGPDSGLIPATIDGVACYRRALQMQPAILVHDEARRVSLTLPPRRAEVASEILDGKGDDERMQRVRLLANERRTGPALLLLAELGARVPLRTDVHVLTALVAEDAGDVRLMLEAARRACFLVPDLPAPNYFLSVAFARNGELRRAALHRRIAASALRSANNSAQIMDFSEGLTAGQLRRLIGAIAR